jgi:hypothetical protein
MEDFSSWAEYKDEIVRRWWLEDEAYRDEIAGLSAGAARAAPDPESTFALWLSWAETPTECVYGRPDLAGPTASPRWDRCTPGRVCRRNEDGTLGSEVPTQTPPFRGADLWPAGAERAP